MFYSSILFRVASLAKVQMHDNPNTWWCDPGRFGKINHYVNSTTHSKLLCMLCFVYLYCIKYCVILDHVIMRLYLNLRIIDGFLCVFSFTLVHFILHIIANNFTRELTLLCRPMFCPFIAWTALSLLVREEYRVSFVSSNLIYVLIWPLVFSVQYFVILDHVIRFDCVWNIFLATDFLHIYNRYQILCTQYIL